MLDENLPTFFIKPPGSDNPHLYPILLRECGSELQPKYALCRPDPNDQASKACYAIALCDSYNSDVLYGEVLVRPEWTQPTIKTAEARSQTPQVPIVPNSFTIQLYNPDQQVVVKQIAGKWNASTYWEFQMLQNSFRIPSSSELDRSQNAPAIVTPKMTFKWKRDGKLSRDISCFLVGKNIEGKKNKEPDITIGLFKGTKTLTIYQPNMHRVEVEDLKGLEVILLLSGVVIKDIFFNPTKEMFNIQSASGVKGKSTPLEVSGSQNIPPNLMSRSSSTATVTLPATNTATSNTYPAKNSKNSSTQQEIDAETERLKRIFEAEKKALEDAEKEEKRRILEMLELEEEEERRQREERARIQAQNLRLPLGSQNFKTGNSPIPPHATIHPISTSPANQHQKLYTQASNTLVGGGNKLLCLVQKAQKKKSTYF